MARKRSVPPIIWTILCILILALGTTRYAKSANVILIVAGLILRALFAILVLHAWWRYHQRHAQANDIPPDASGGLLRKVLQWTTDEQTSAEAQTSQSAENNSYHSPARRWSTPDIVMAVLVIITVIVMVALWLR